MDKVQKKLNNIRTYYKREVNKMQDSKRSGSGATDTYESKWPMYAALDRFLRPHVKKRKSKSNMVSNPKLHVKYSNCQSVEN